MPEAPRTRLPLVESARGIAALSIVGFHGLWLFDFHYRGGTLANLFNQLDVGVPIFFAISGLLLYSPFLRERQTGVRLELRAYAWRRALRILPAAWVALALAAVILPITFVEHRPALFFGFGTLWDPKDLDGPIHHYWTLCVEISFYAFLPLWAAVRRRVTPALGVELALLASVYVASVGWQVYAGLHPDPVAALRPATVWLLPFLDQFVVGMAIAALVVHRRISQRAERLLPFGWLVAALAFVAAALLLHPAIDGLGLSTRWNNTLYSIARHQLQAVVALGVLAPAIAGSGGVARWLLGRRLLLWLGTISYGIYLYHFPVMNFTLRHGLVPADLMWWPVVLGSTIALATFSWYVIERPALSLKSLVPRWRAPLPGVARDPA